MHLHADCQHWSTLKLRLSSFRLSPVRFRHSIICFCNLRFNWVSVQSVVFRVTLYAPDRHFDDAIPPYLLSHNPPGIPPMSRNASIIPPNHWTTNMPPADKWEILITKQRNQPGDPQNILSNRTSTGPNPPWRSPPHDKRGLLHGPKEHIW